MKTRYKYWILMLILFYFGGSYEIHMFAKNLNINIPIFDTAFIVMMSSFFCLGFIFGIIYANLTKDKRSTRKILQFTNEAKDGIYTFFIAFNEILTGPLMCYVVVSMLMGYLYKTRKET